MEKILDPRFIRTRKLIKDAFLALVVEKDFKDITIKDITHKATINRATFYYHFLDKYDLMEKVLSEDVVQEVLKDVTSHALLTPDVLMDIFYSLITFHSSLANQCSRSYEVFTPKIEAVIKDTLSVTFKQGLEQDFPSWSAEKIELHSTMISWGIFGMSLKYVKNGELPSEVLIQEMFQTFLKVKQLR